MKKQTLFITLILLVGLSIGIWREKFSSHQGITSWGQKATLTVGTALPLPQAIPAFSLTDMQGQTFTEASFKDHWSLLVFGYTRCPEICPTILKSMTQVHRYLKPRAQIESVFVSIEPEHDTPDNLKQFFDKEPFNSMQIRGVTGPKPSIQALAEEVGLHLEEATQDAKHIGHSGTMLLINPEGKITALFTSANEPSAIAADIKSMMHRYSRG